MSATVYQSKERTAAFHRFLRLVVIQMLKARPTPFHEYVGGLAEKGVLLRAYFQNLDDLDTRVPYLSTRVPLPHQPPFPNLVQVHGSFGWMVCDKCFDSQPLDLNIVKGDTLAPCPQCPRETPSGRTTNPGRLRARYAPYDGNDLIWDADAISEIQQYDLEQEVDLFIVAGTQLKLPNAKSFVRDMSAKVQARGGLSVWVSKEPPRKAIAGYFDIVVKGSSDKFAMLMDPN